MPLTPACYLTNVNKKVDLFMVVPQLTPAALIRNLL